MENNNNSNKPFYKNLWFIITVAVMSVSLIISISAKNFIQKNIDLSSLESTSSYSSVSTTTTLSTTTAAPTTTSTVVETTPITTAKQTTTAAQKAAARQNVGTTVYITPTGKRYHLISTCGGKNSTSTSLDSAINSGYTPCKKCAS